MKRAALFIFVVLIGLTFTQTVAFPGEVTLFGPKQYLRTTGEPNYYFDTFVGAQGQGNLLIKNGNYDGGRRVEDGVSSAWIHVNGVLIFSPSDFNKQIYTLEATVDLSEQNILEIELSSTPYSYLTIDITENIPAPTISSFSTDSESIIMGQSATLTWTTDADSVSIDQGIGSVATSGSISVTPSQTTTFTITATGLGGTTTAHATVTVLHPPSVALEAAPAIVLVGESSTLAWTATNADTVSIDQGVGTVDLTGSVSVTPLQTTTYTLTATGSGGTTTTDAIVTVLQPPVVSIEANPGTVHTGEFSTLAWTATNADSVSIDQGIGQVDPTGSVTVSLSQTTTYTLTAVNSDGTTTNSVTVIFENTAPVATDDVVSTEENIPVTTANLLLNDSDIDGDTLVVSGFDQATNGTVVNHGDGTFTYTPNDGFSGSDSFTYTVSDGQGGTDTGTVEIEVIPGILTLEITSPTAGQEFTSASITVTGTVNRPAASVFVNGIAATVSGGEYTAEDVPLAPGANTISVLVEDGDDTQIVSVTVMLLATIDLEPVQVEISSDIEDDGSAKVSGQATVTVANNGSSAVATPYRAILFEDTNLSQSYEEQEDNRLGETTIPAGPGAGEAINTSIDFFGQLSFRDNRIHVFIDSADEIAEDDEENNIVATRSNGIDLSTSFLTMDAVGCPDEVALTARIGNAGDASIQSGVPVTFYDGDPGNGGTLIGTVLTTQDLESGQYEDLTLQWYDPTAGITIIYAQADDGGTGVGTIGETDETNNLVFSEVAVCTSLPTTDGMSGQVIDAQTSAFLSGVTVYLHEDDNGLPGSVIDQTVSDAYGGFAFPQINPGTYYIIANQQGYIEGKRQVVFLPNDTLTHQDMVLSPVLNPGEFRIVLTWGENPADLEAHLTAPNPNGCREHCFYWNRTITGASLDVDDGQSYGPETITISQMDPGTYRFYVHDFTNRNSANTTALAGSGATVMVYSGNGDASLTYNVPAGAGNVWHVFNLDGASGTITRIDKLSHQSQPGEIDFPKITSLPGTRATNGELYTYQIEAEDPDLDTLTYTLIEGPEGMSLDPFSGLVEWTPSPNQGGMFDVEIRVNDGRCGEDTQIFRIYVDYLPIATFEVEPCSGVNPGGEITLTWHTERAGTVVLDQGIGAVATSGSISIPSPEQPVRFNLTASNGAGQVQRAVPKSASIIEFSADCVNTPGGTSLLTWVSSCATSCQIDQGIGDVPTIGTYPVTPTELPAAYTLTCTNGTGVASQKIFVNACSPEADINAVPDCGWSPGDPVTLTWSASGVDNCLILPDVGNVDLSGSVIVTPTEDTTIYTLSCNGAEDSVAIKSPRTVELRATNTTLLPGESTSLYWMTNCIETVSFDQGVGEVPTSGSLVVTPEQLPVTYTLTATYEQHTSTTPITLTLPFPEAIFSASPAQIKSGESATLTWATELATSCTIEPDIGEVPLSGSIAVSPDQTTRYTLTAVGPGGTTKRTVTVAYVKPTASIFADPEHLDLVGQPSILTWVFSNADTCVIDQGIGEVELGGSVVVTPQVTTTYTITATGPGGTAKDSVTVGYTRPTVEIHADKDILDEGETATLTWTFSNADTCIIDQAIGEVQSGGSIVVDPDRTTTYTIRAIGPGGESWDQVTLTCLAPTALIQADPATIIEGQSATLTWQADHASSYNIEPGIGTVASNGSVAVSPEVTTNYTLTASGRGGEITAQVTLAVVNPPSISVTEPDGNDDQAHNSYTIQWNDADHDSNAVISLYYDINNNGADGTLIASGISEDPDGQEDTYVWDTTDISPGPYYVYARIEDGTSDPVIAYSSGVVTIDHAVTDKIKLTAIDGEAYDNFGETVAIDGGYAVVGAPYSGDTGAAYVFKKEGTSWVEQIKLVPDDAVTGDNFGASVSIGGNTIVVGAPSGNGDSGAAYVFTYDGISWTHQTRLIASDGEDWDNFGVCVAVSGATIAVGSPGNGTSGAVYVFTGQNESWSQMAKLATGSADGSTFGSSVAIDGDALIAGDPFANNSTGAAFIFRRAGSEWNEESQLISADAAPWSYYGAAVSISGNYAVVGSPGLSEAGTESAVYIFNNDGSAWIEQTKISSSSINAGESFGESVFINGDMAAVGQPKMSNAGGAVYLFQRSDSQWVTIQTPIPGEGEGGEDPIPGEGEEIPPSEGGGEGETATAAAVLTPSDGAAGDFFGSSVAMDDDHLIVGSKFDDDKGSDSGSAYIFPLFSVSISANPDALYLGGEGSATTTLSWTSRVADAVTITPDIGAVDASGSAIVAPQQTTTYTITGTKDGATVTDSVTVTVIDPSVLPTVTIEASPETIALGESATLSWTTTNVVFVTLDNEIGTAPMSGILVVSPELTTTYTVTAVNAAGVVSASVTIMVKDPVPTVQLAVQLAEIEAGESAMLFWSSAHAHTVSIEPDIGTVDPSGTLSVMPMQTTTYTITAMGTGGTANQSATVTVNSPISIQIHSPADGASVDRPNVMVRGTFSNSSDSETGITVNGVVAMVYGNEFILKFYS